MFLLTFCRGILFYVLHIIQKNLHMNFCTIFFFIFLTAVYFSYASRRRAISLFQPSSSLGVSRINGISFKAG